MSRSHYDETCEGWELTMWRGAVRSAIRGKRGQELLREMAAALDSMPCKELIATELEVDGARCAMGVVGAKRGMDIATLDPDDPGQIADAFGIAGAMAQEIAFINDEAGPYDGETPAERWTRVRAWVDEQIVKRKVKA